MNFFFIVVLVP